MSDIQIFITDKDNEGEWRDIDEGLLDLSSHDAKVRNKAIDDFVKACKEDILCQTFGLHQNGIEKIAEQLKAGEGCKNPDVLKVEISQEDLLELKERMKNLPLTIVSTPEVESSIEFIDEQTIRNIAIDNAMERAAEAICIGCGYLKGTKCTYTGCNCGVSKPMLETVMKALEQLKAGEE